MRLGILREGETFLTIRFCNRFQFVMWPAESCFVSYITTLLTKVNRPFFALWNVALTCVKQSAEHSAETLSSPSFYLFLTIPTLSLLSYPFLCHVSSCSQRTCCWPVRWRGRQWSWLILALPSRCREISSPGLVRLLCFSFNSLVVSSLKGIWLNWLEAILVNPDARLN